MTEESVESCPGSESAAEVSEGRDVVIFSMKGYEVADGKKGDEKDCSVIHVGGPVGGEGFGGVGEEAYAADVGDNHGESEDPAGHGVFRADEFFWGLGFLKSEIKPNENVY